jgi:putative colanic acid biosynthesis UDP-glucose lipid carrier transferase
MDIIKGGRSLAWPNHLQYFGMIFTQQLKRQLLLKRLLDVVAGVSLLILTLPLMGVIALAIKLDSPGPILFRQRRFIQAPFTIYKFRTMYLDACHDSTIRQARRHDPRVTRTGGLLRRYSFDELPQLFNVIRGDMSLVGPRPHAITHDKKYADLLGEVYLIRHQVKPGLTGWAQINGMRGETDDLNQMRERLRHDRFYIENWSLTLDLKILCKTSLVFVIHQNAY